jgi:hypothetical protein
MTTKPAETVLRADICTWHIAKFCCNTKLGRNLGKADRAGPAAISTRS